MTSLARQSLLDLIEANRGRAVEFLQALIAIPSVTGDEAAVQQFLAAHLQTMGLALDVWETDWEALKQHPGYRPVDRGYEGRPNIVATLKGEGGGRSLLLNGHTDVIPVAGEGWSDDPWSATIRDGRIYGRGSADMKSGVASHIMAVAFLQQAGVRLRGDVLLDIVVDEEVSGHGTLDTVARGYHADAGISGETSDLAVQPACIGRIWFEIDDPGQGGRDPAALSGRERDRAGLYDCPGGGGAGGGAGRDGDAPAVSQCDRLAAVHHRELPGGRVSQRVPVDGVVEGEHRHGAGRGPCGGEAEPGGPGRPRRGGGPVDEGPSAEGQVQGV